MAETSTSAPDPKPEPRTTSTTTGPYVYTIGGDAGKWGGPHEAGDVVPSSAPSHKLTEWESAGVIKRVQKPPRKDKK